MGTGRAAVRIHRLLQEALEGHHNRRRHGVYLLPWCFSCSSSERDVPRFVYEFFHSYNIKDESECSGCGLKKWVFMTLKGSIFADDCLLVFLRNQASVNVLAAAPDRFGVTEALAWEPPFPASMAPHSVRPYVPPSSLYGAAVQSNNVDVQQGPFHTAPGTSPARILGNLPLSVWITTHLSPCGDSWLAMECKRTPEEQKSFEARAAPIPGHQGLLDLFTTVLYGDRTTSQPK